MGADQFSLLVMTWGFQRAQASEFLDVTQHAERLGLYSVGLPHVTVLPHPDEDPPAHLVLPVEVQDYYLDPLVLLPMMAHATRSIRIGLNVLIAPGLHPFVTAKYCASLDVASGGRFIAGFGLGYRPPNGACKSLDNIGIDGGRRGKLSDEVLECTMRLWSSTEPVSFEGAYVGKDLVVDPKPVQKPYPELWWAGEAEPSIVRAAKYARYLELAWITPARIREHYIPAVRAANQRYGGSAEIAIFLPMTITDSALNRNEISGMYYNWGGDMLKVIAVGNAEQCASVVRDYRTAGVRHFVLDLHRHGMDSVSSIHDQLDRFAQQVLPLL